MTGTERWKDSTAILHGLGVAPGDDVQGRTFVNVDLSECLVNDVNFTGCSFVECSFENSRVQHSNFVGCTFDKVVFDKALIVNVDFTNARFVRCVMRSATLAMVYFRDVVFLEAERNPSWLSFNEIDPEYPEVFNEHLSSLDDGSALDATGSRLFGTDFFNSLLFWCNFSECEFISGTMHGSWLLHTKMRNSALIDFDLSGANLTAPFFGHTWRDYNPGISSGGHWDWVMGWDDFLGVAEGATNLEDTWVDLSGIRHNSDEWSDDGESVGTQWPRDFTPGSANASRDEFNWFLKALWWPEIKGAFGYPDVEDGS